VNLKALRRKAATLERELEQERFSNTSSVKEKNEMICGLNKSLGHLKKEHEALFTRLDKNMKDYQHKMETERSAHMETKEKLRISEEFQERMQIEIDNLNKKVNFFKANTYGRKGADSSANVSDDQEPACSLIETTNLKNGLKCLIQRLNTLKAEFFKEKQVMEEQIANYRNHIFSLCRDLGERTIIEARKNKHLHQNWILLKKENQHLMKIHEELSIKFESHKSMSKMTTLLYSDHQNYESNNSIIQKAKLIQDKRGIKKTELYQSKSVKTAKQNTQHLDDLPPQISGSSTQRYSQAILEPISKNKLFEKKPRESRSITSASSHLSSQSSNLRQSDHSLRNYKKLEFGDMEVAERMKRIQENVTRERRRRDRKEYYGKENILLKPSGPNEYNHEMHDESNFLRKDGFGKSMSIKKFDEMQAASQWSGRNTQRMERASEALTDRTNNMSSQMMSDRKMGYNPLTERSANAYTDRSSYMGDRYEAHQIRFKATGPQGLDQINEMDQQG
jgi:hypothetical protein